MEHRGFFPSSCVITNSDSEEKTTINVETKHKPDSRLFRRTNCFSKSNSASSSFLLFAFLFVILYFSLPAEAQTSPAPQSSEEVNRCLLNETKTCKTGVILPLWPPAEVDKIPTSEKVGRAIVYFLCLVYLFLGVSIIADRFMASIEVITSKEREITMTKPNGEVTVTSVRVWNETVSNLSLMALGSSAPEILLSVIEVVGKGFRAGDLGPATIVGSASFNLFIIIAICMYVIPDDEVRKVKHPRVFFITAAWSIMAYIWLYLIIAVFSKGVIEIWEGVVTFLFFPMLVVWAWIADRRFLVYKYMYKRYRKRGNRRNVVVEMEGSAAGELRDIVGDEEMRNLAKGSNAGTLNRSMDTLEGNVSIDFDGVADPSWDGDAQKREIIRLLRKLKKKHPNADMHELARMAKKEALNSQQKSRAFYRIQATRKLTGAGNILKTRPDQLGMTESLHDVAESDDDLIARISFEPSEYKVMENCGFAEIQVVRHGGDLNTAVYVDYSTEDGTANAGSDYEFTEGTVIFRPGETLHMIKIPIIDDDIFEEDECFRVKLHNVRIMSADGNVETNSNRLARLEPPMIANVVILDDDHAGVFAFSDSSTTVSESVGILHIPVKRDSGARGCVVIPYKTSPNTAMGGGEDYIDAFGELEFSNDETMYVHISSSIDPSFNLIPKIAPFCRSVTRLGGLLERKRGYYIRMFSVLRSILAEDHILSWEIGIRLSRKDFPLFDCKRNVTVGLCHLCGYKETKSFIDLELSPESIRCVVRKEADVIRLLVSDA